jgi:Family of unknown function (DUF5681)
MIASYKIGYGKPPKHSRFKKGKSGNPKGRPKESLSLANDLSAELGEDITVSEEGRRRKVTKQRALVKALLAKALAGDVRATSAVLALRGRVLSESSEERDDWIEAEELQIVRRFAPRLIKSIRSK